MTSRVLVVVSSDRLRERYEPYLRDRGIEFLVTGSLLDLPEDDAEGFLAALLDVSTASRASVPERVVQEQLERRLPMARIRWDPAEDCIRCLPSGRLAGEATRLEPFLARAAELHAPERLRRAPRSVVYLSVALNPATGRGKGLPRLRATTLDVSDGGCFVITGEPWPVGTRGTLSFAATGDALNLSVIVRWVLPWGIPRRAPGMGLQFEAVAPADGAALNALLAAYRGPTG